MCMPPENIRTLFFTKNMIWYIKVVFIASSAISTISAASNDTISKKKFPDNFQFGTATASYQIEGGWNSDGKGEHIWDHLCHYNSTAVYYQQNGDIACDSYHKYKEDVAMLKYLGVNYYRFSIAWTRIFPYGYSFKLNQPGVDYYSNLIQELLDNGIEPLITLFHWDTPQVLQDIGGWINPEIIDVYAEYARFAFAAYGDRVKNWVTFNEPKQTCQMGYGSGSIAPLIESPGIGEYLCTHNLLKAHAKAYHIYDEEFRATQNGKVSIVVDSEWWQAATDSIEDETAAETMRQFTFGWYYNPIVHGNYPQIMIDRIAERSKHEGFSKSRLPEFTNAEIEYIKGTYDFIAINSYTSSLVEAQGEIPYNLPGYYLDIGVHSWQPEDWESGISDWLKVTPWGMRRLLKWIKDTYNNPEIVITENGYSDEGAFEDTVRQKYILTYLSNVLDAIYLDGVNVTSYTLWSLMDNFEWRAGYSNKFGLYHVDFDSDNRTRTPKDSAKLYKKIVETHCLVDTCDE